MPIGWTDGHAGFDELTDLPDLIPTLLFPLKHPPERYIYAAFLHVYLHSDDNDDGDDDCEDDDDDSDSDGADDGVSNDNDDIVMT